MKIKKGKGKHLAGKPKAFKKCRNRFACLQNTAMYIARAFKWDSTPQYLYFCLLSFVYLACVAPVLCAISSIAILLSSLVVVGISQFVAISKQSQYLFVGLLGTTFVFSLLPLPSYALLDGFETTVGTIITATGGGIAPETAALITNILRLGVFVCIFILLAVAALSRQDEERLKGVAIGGIVFISIIVLMEVAGNYIFKRA